LALAAPKTLLSARGIAFAAAALAFAIALFAPAILDDADTYWHIAAGRWMLENQAVLRIDPFSYTFGGHPWQTHEWLAEIAMALAYIGAGWDGVVILFGTALALTAGLLARHLAHRLVGLSLIAVLLLSLACVAGSLVARPHLLALPLLEIWATNLVFAREERRAPSWHLLPIMALWANLHASFLIGLGLVVAFALEAVLEDSRTRVATLRRWGLFGGLALLAALVTPYGLDGLIFPIRLMVMPSLQPIGGWQATSLWTFLPLVIAAVAAFAILLWRKVTVTPLRIAILFGLLTVALIDVRHQMLIAIVGPLILAQPLGRALHNVPRPDGPTRIAAGLAFVFVFALLAALRLLLPLERGDGATTPATAFAHVPAALAKSAVLNDYGFGGYLIFNDVRPFIDSRAGLYGARFLGRYAEMVSPDKAALAAALAKYHVRWTIFVADSPAVGAMDTMAGWHRQYADRWAVVHVRDDAP